MTRFPPSANPPGSAGYRERDPLDFTDPLLRRLIDSYRARHPLPPPPTSATVDGLRTPAEAARKTRKPRRLSVSKMIEQAEKAGKPLASLTLPDGTKLDFSKPEPAEPDNAWPLDEFRTKETKQ